MSKELAVREPPTPPPPRYPEPETDRKLMSVKDVAEYLGNKVSARAIRNEVRAGRMRCWVISGAWRFRRAWVDEWLEKGPQEQTDFSEKKHARNHKRKRK
jgi:excisionase family DNA binding protein